jgi:hypothetical protein
MPTYFIPRKDADFLLWTRNFMSALSGYYSRFHFPSADDEQFAKLREDIADFRKSVFPKNQKRNESEMTQRNQQEG